jgi:hypothetical protein
MNRKTLCVAMLAVALACAAALAACGKDSGGSGTEAAVKAAAKPAPDFWYGLSEDGKGVVIYTGKTQRMGF